MRSVEWEPEVARGRAKSEDASSNGVFLVARPAFELLFASRGGFLRRMDSYQTRNLGLVVLV